MSEELEGEEPEEGQEPLTDYNARLLALLKELVTSYYAPRRTRFDNLFEPMEEARIALRLIEAATPSRVAAWECIGYDPQGVPRTVGFGETADEAEKESTDEAARRIGVYHLRRKLRPLGAWRFECRKVPSWDKKGQL